MPPDVELAVDRRARRAAGAQLAARIRAALRDGTLSAGDRLPSVRVLADAAGVNVNTARAVYARLESEGLVRSEQGRGTFVAGARERRAATRRELRRQIAQARGGAGAPPAAPRSRTASEAARRRARLLSTEGLEAVRDEPRHAAAASSTPSVPRCERGWISSGSRSRGRPRRATPSLAGARIRWVGA